MFSAFSTAKGFEIKEHTKNILDTEERIMTSLSLWLTEQLQENPSFKSWQQSQNLRKRIEDLSEILIILNGAAIFFYDLFNFLAEDSQYFKALFKFSDFSCFTEKINLYLPSDKYYKGQALFDLYEFLPEAYQAFLLRFTLKQFNDLEDSIIEEFCLLLPKESQAKTRLIFTFRLEQYLDFSGEYLDLNKVYQFCSTLDEQDRILLIQLLPLDVFYMRNSKGEKTKLTYENIKDFYEQYKRENKCSPRECNFVLAFILELYCKTRILKPETESNSAWLASWLWSGLTKKEKMQAMRFCQLALLGNQGLNFEAALKMDKKLASVFNNGDFKEYFEPLLLEAKSILNEMQTLKAYNL